MHIGRIQRTLTVEPVVDPVPGAEPGRPVETVAAPVPEVPVPAAVAADGASHREVTEETVG